MNQQASNKSKPRLNNLFFVIPISRDEIHFKSFQEIYKFEFDGAEKVINTLLKYLNGRYSINQIKQKVSQQTKATQKEIFIIIGELFAYNLLVDDNGIFDDLDLEHKRYDNLRLNQVFRNKTRNKSFAVVGLGNISASLIKSLNDLGVKNFVVITTEVMAKTKKQAKSYGFIQKKNLNIKFITIDQIKQHNLTLKKKIQMIIYANEHLNYSYSEILNDFILKEKISLLMGGIFQDFGIIGPMIVPGISPCIKCLSNRFQSNLEKKYETFIIDLLTGKKNKRMRKLYFSDFKPYFLILSELLSIEIFRYYTGSLVNSTIDTLNVLNFKTLENERFKLLKVPGCCCLQ